MPHIVIEHSKGLENSHDLQALCDMLWESFATHATITAPDTVRVRAMGPVFRAAGLTASQWDALETLNNKGHLSINDLMALTLSTSGNLDVVIKNLIQAGWVEKAVDKQDRRARVLRLTEAGKAKVDSFMPIHNASLDNIFGQLTSDEKRQTISTLNRLRKKLPQSKKD